MFEQNNASIGPERTGIADNAPHWSNDNGPAARLKFNPLAGGSDFVLFSITGFYDSGNRRLGRAKSGQASGQSPFVYIIIGRYLFFVTGLIIFLESIIYLGFYIP